MAHPLENVFLRAAYRVRLARGGYASIRIGEPLTAALAGLLPEAGAGWGFVTAWNPRGEARGRWANRRAQRDLRDLLRSEHPRACLRAGLGTLGQWREPSLFVAGIDGAALDSLMPRLTSWPWCARADIPPRGCAGPPPSRPEPGPHRDGGSHGHAPYALGKWDE